MTEDILALVKALGRVDERDGDALEALCVQAEKELLGRLRDGLSRADCGGAFDLGAAWLVLAELCVASSAEEVESFTAGDLTIRKGDGSAAARRSRDLRREGERVMAPYLKDRTFLFRGVRG